MINAYIIIWLTLKIIMIYNDIIDQGLWYAIIRLAKYYDLQWYDWWKIMIYNDMIGKELWCAIICLAKYYDMQ